MNDSDPIVDEVRRIRDAYAARFNYDLRAIFEDIKEQQKRSGLKFVSFARDGSLLPSNADAESDQNQPGQPRGPAMGVPPPAESISSPKAGHGG